jgi:hypothetical protein
VCSYVRVKTQTPSRHMFKRCWTASLDLLTTPHLMVNIIGRIYVFS